MFLENQCLQFLGNHTFHEASVLMVREYTAGIQFVMQHGSNGAVETATHVDYLHNPHNLFTACSILATHGIEHIEPTAIYKDITTLIQLCPTRDAAWDECHRKLRDLAQSDGGNYFSVNSAYGQYLIRNFANFRPTKSKSKKTTSDMRYMLSMTL